MTDQPTGPVPDRITLTRSSLAVLLAHHADVLATAFRTDASTGLPGYRDGLNRAADLLGLHADHLTAEEETRAVTELLDSMLTCPIEQPAPEDRAALRDRIAGVIRRFPFDDYGLDDVSYLLEGEPDTQEWVPKLADAVLAELPDPVDQAAEIERLRVLLREATAGAAVADDLAAEWRKRAKTDRGAVLRWAADELDRYVGLQSSDDAPEVEGARLVIRELRRLADEAQPTPTPAVDLPTLAAALDGLHTLIATSSRDWQTYRVDAWLWAVLCGWDCEQAEHDETCTHGALEETAAMHGWDAATMAKARRYRASVRALIEAHGYEAQPTTEAQPQPCAHCGKDILRRSGTLTVWWVHDPGGNTSCFPQHAASSTRATPKPVTEERHTDTGPVKESTRRYAAELRSNPGTVVADGHTGWECDAGASLIVEASTPGPGKLGTHHGVIYACAGHRAAAEERITGAGYEVDPRSAPPGHRWNPWPCGHVTAHDSAALAALAVVDGPTAGARQDGAQQQEADRD